MHINRGPNGGRGTVHEDKTPTCTTLLTACLSAWALFEGSDDEMSGKYLLRPSMVFTYPFFLASLINVMTGQDNSRI